MSAEFHASLSLSGFLTSAPGQEEESFKSINVNTAKIWTCSVLSLPGGLERMPNEAYTMKLFSDGEDFDQTDLSKDYEPSWNLNPKAFGENQVFVPKPDQVASWQCWSKRAEVCISPILTPTSRAGMKIVKSQSIKLLSGALGEREHKP